MPNLINPNDRIGEVWEYTSGVERGNRYLILEYLGHGCYRTKVIEFTECPSYNVYRLGSLHNIALLNGDSDSPDYTRWKQVDDFEYWVQYVRDNHANGRRSGREEREGIVT